MFDEHNGESSTASEEPAFTSQLSPKEIQQRIRNGETIESLAHAAGAPYAHVERFAAPILDELEHMLNQALNTPVITAAHQEDDQPQTFGRVIQERLKDAYEAEPEWSIWKDLLTNHWIVQLSFVLKNETVDARWQYEPRKQLLNANNNAAINISAAPNPRQVDPIIPTHADNDEVPGNVTRFDSGAFQPDLTQFDTVELQDPVAYGRLADTEAVITELYRQPEEAQGVSSSTDQADTQELLEELEQLRGQRIEQEPMLTISEYENIELPLDEFDFDGNKSATAENSGQQNADENSPQDPPKKAQEHSHRKRRQQVPSWDEIVFGTKPEDNNF